FSVRAGARATLSGPRSQSLWFSCAGGTTTGRGKDATVRGGAEKNCRLPRRACLASSRAPIHSTSRWQFRHCGHRAQRCFLAPRPVACLSSSEYVARLACAAHIEGIEVVRADGPRISTCNSRSRIGSLDRRLAVVTTIVLPRAPALTDAKEATAAFDAFEQRFALQARISILLVGLSGVYISAMRLTILGDNAPVFRLPPRYSINTPRNTPQSGS